METVTLEVFAVEISKCVGLRQMEPTGPAGVCFGLYLPAKGENLINYRQLVDMGEECLIDSPLFPWKISYVHINHGDYKEDSSVFLAQHLPEMPLSEDCRISCPSSLIFGRGL